MARSLLLAAALVGGCDDTGAGQAAQSLSPPRVVHVFLVDWSTFTQIDLLDDGPAAPCDDSHPCPLGAPGAAPVCSDGDGGVCLSPTAASQGAAVGAPGLEVRVVVSKPLDADRVERVFDGGASLIDPTVVQVAPAGGAPVPIASSYYDPGGATDDTDEPVVDPQGPAVVVDLAATLAYATRYTLTVRGSSLVDRLGQAVTTDVDGLLAPYPFTTVAAPAPADGGP